MILATKVDFADLSINLGNQSLSVYKIGMIILLSVPTMPRGPGSRFHSKVTPTF